MRLYKRMRDLHILHLFEENRDSMKSLQFSGMKFPWCVFYFERMVMAHDRKGSLHDVSLRHTTPSALLIAVLADPPSV